MNQGKENIGKVLESYIESIAEQKLLTKMQEMKAEILSSQKPFLTLNDVMKITGLSRSSIYRYVNESKIAYYKPNGKNLFFSWDDVNNFIFSQEHYFRAKSTLEMEAETAIILDSI